jgi:DNA-binding transcriptional MerR regulator
VRVWELAEQLGVETSDVIAFLRARGEWVSSHLSAMPEPFVSEVTAANLPPRTRPYPWDRPVDHDASRATSRQPGAAAGPSPANVFATTAGMDTPPPGYRRLRPGRRRPPGPKRITLKRPTDPDDHDDDFYDVEAFPYDDAMSTRDIADYCHVDPATVRQWVARGYLTPTGNLGPSHIFDTREVLDAWDAIKDRRHSARRAQLRHGTPERRPAVSRNELERRNRVQPERLLDVTEAAGLLGVAPATIRSWVHRGRLTPAPASRPRHLRFRMTDLYAARRRRPRRRR